MAPAPARPLLRSGLALVLLAYLALAAVSGLDRLSPAHPGLAALVPAPFRANAARVLASDALAKGQHGAALAFAREAVDHDPVIARSSGLLGAARLAEPSAGSAEAAFRISGQFGWRDPLTQLYWFGKAQAAGDMAQAALRADAVLRADPHSRFAPRLLAALEGSAAGRAALAERLAARPAWLESYLAPPATATDSEVELRAQVALALAQRGTRLGCRSPRPLVQALLAQGTRGLAEQVWSAHCPGDALRGGIADPGFAALSSGESQSPFGWQRVGSGDVELTFARQGKGAMLTARNSAPVSRLMLFQAVNLAPGRYGLRGTLAGGEVFASLDCAAYPSFPASTAGQLGGGGQVLTVGECDRQVLGLWLPPMSGPVSLGGLTLEKLD